MDNQIKLEIALNIATYKAKEVQKYVIKEMRNFLSNMDKKEIRVSQIRMALANCFIIAIKRVYLKGDDIIIVYSEVFNPLLAKTISEDKQQDKTIEFNSLLISEKLKLMYYLSKYCNVNKV